MIGSSVTPQFYDLAIAFWPSIFAILAFILIAHSGGFLIMRKIGGYSRKDAYFASMPGGLIEAVMLGEKAGADVRILTIQHFIRIIIVVLTVPFLFLAATGEVVGSAAGENFGGNSYSLKDVALIAAISGAGLLMGRKLNLPAGHLMGPLLLCFILQVSGTTDIATPNWLLQTAQFVIAASLSSGFAGLNREMLTKGVSMGLLAVGFMLCLSLGIAVLLDPVLPADLSALFISFAPGGLSEMSLIALSLDMSPVIVAMHHLIRITATVWIGIRVARYLFPGDL
jgi:membrane AbrB-like protein